jgi:hypothetical protein
VIETDFDHAEMFPYAISIAKRRGAQRILVGEPRLRSSSGNKWVVPDVLGIRDSMFIIVECEKSHGNIFDEGGKLHSWSLQTEIIESCELHFILRGNAFYRRDKIREYFGDRPNLFVYRFEELIKEVTPIVL